MDIFLLSTILFVLGLGVTYWVHTQYHLDIRVEPSPPPVSGPLLSMCIPARNEERNIRRCVESVFHQDYPRLEVLVLDDRSTDSTPEILEALRGLAESRKVPFRVLHGAELPPGWAGKPHALQQAADAAAGHWLCFIDADTFLDPQALSSVYAGAVASRADLFTIMTAQIMGSFWEKAVMPLVMSALSVGFSPRRVNDPQKPDAIANGQFILIRRSVYEAIGGHAAIRDQIVEDKVIAERVKWGGYRLVVADGSRVARTRMYTSLAGMWEGWTKNIYLGLRDRPSLLWLGAFGALLLVLAAIGLPLWPAAGILWLLRGGGGPALGVIAEALVLWWALLAARGTVARRMGISPWWALTTPLGAAVFAGMMLTSAWKVLSGRGVTWKGRLYSLK